MGSSSRRMSKRGREGEENPTDADESASAVLKRQKQDASGKAEDAGAAPAKEKLGGSLTAAPAIAGGWGAPVLNFGSSNSKAAAPGVPSFPGLLSSTASGGKAPSFSFSSKPSFQLGGDNKFGGLSFLTKPLASLEKEEEGKKKFWTIKLQGATTTIQQGETGSLGTTEEKKHDTADQAEAFAKAQVEAQRGGGWADATTQGAAAAPKLLFGSADSAGTKDTKALNNLFGSVTSTKAAAPAPETVASGSKLTAEEQEKLDVAAKNSFSNFKMPSFSANPDTGLGGKPANLSFGASSSAATSAPPPSTSGFSSLFGSALGADGEASKATTFDASAADSAALTEALGAAAEQSLGSPAGAADMKMKTVDLAKIDAKTGEEAEEILIQVKDAKLFVFCKEEGDAGKWREAGRGTLNVNSNPDTKQVRIVMRRHETKQLVLNAALWEGMPYTFAGEKDLRISCCALESDEIKQHLIRVMGEPTLPKMLDSVITKVIAKAEEAK